MDDLAYNAVIPTFFQDEPEAKDAYPIMPQYTKTPASLSKSNRRKQQPCDRPEQAKRGGDWHNTRRLSMQKVHPHGIRRKAGAAENDHDRANACRNGRVQRRGIKEKMRDDL